MKALLSCLIFLFLSTTPSSTYADQEQAYIKKLWSSPDSELISKHKSDNYYLGHGGTKNYYAHFFVANNSIKNPLIIITGAEDPIPLWFDTALAAMQKGFQSIYIIEIRGQGQSERVAGNNTKALHLNHFANYDSDLVAAFKDINSKNPFSVPGFIISHSTGSLILAQSLPRLKSELPHLRIQAMSFWTPFFRLKVSPLLNNFVVRPTLSAVEKVYASCCGLIMARKYKRKKFSENKLTTDPQKFARIQSIKFEYKLGSSGASLRWGIDALVATKNLRAQNFQQIHIPTLILKAEKDEVVSNDYKVINKKITIKTIKDAQHALHAESESIFDKTTKETFSFFKQAFD